MDFDAINAAALARYPDLLFRWFPAGVIEGHEFKIGGLHGEKGRSMSVNIRTGVWGDFATNETGSDPVSLRAAIDKSSQGDAAKRVSEDMGQTVEEPPRMNGHKHKEKPRVSVAPWPDEQGAPKSLRKKIGDKWGDVPVTQSWRWTWADGSTAGYDCRIEMDSGKEVLTIQWGSNGNPFSVVSLTVKGRCSSLIS